MVFVRFIESFIVTYLWGSMHAYTHMHTYMHVCIVDMHIHRDIQTGMHTYNWRLITNVQL